MATTTPADAAVIVPSLFDDLAGFAELTADTTASPAPARRRAGAATRAPQVEVQALFAGLADYPWQRARTHTVTVFPIPPEKGATNGWFGWQCTCGQRSKPTNRWSHADLAQSMGEQHAGEQPGAGQQPAAEEPAETNLLDGCRPGRAGDRLNDVRAVLARSTLHGTVLRLPDEQLPATVWKQVHDTLKKMGAAGGSRKGQPYQFETDRSRDLREFILGGRPPSPERTTVGWVRTPDWVANGVVAKHAELGNHSGPGLLRVLEPSAGDGALIEALLAAAPATELDILAVEPNAERAAALRETLKGHGTEIPVHERTFEDFAAWFEPTLLRRYDLVVMNPPYSVPGNRTIWMDHVRLAWRLLADGGRLVAIVPAVNWSTGKTAGLLADLGDDVVTEALPARAFRESGTDVATCVLVATKLTSGVAAAWRRYAASIYRPAEGDPVLVDEVQTSRAAAESMPVQSFRSFGGGDKVARHVGRCIVCSVTCWSDGDNSPLGALGMNAVAPLIAEEHDMVGPDVCLCWHCYNSGIMAQRGIDKARTLWTPAKIEED